MKLLSTEALHELRSRGISRLYHITDRENLSSISSCGGLCSWVYTADNSIVVPRPGGDAVTHRLDHRRGMDRTVHLFLTQPDEEQIASYVRSGRIISPFVLEVDIEALKPGTQFTVGDSYEGDTMPEDMSLAQVSETMNITMHVPDFIPLRHLRNLPDKYTASISSNQTTAIMFIIDHSKSMSQATELDGVSYDYMSEAVAAVVNRQIETLLNSCVENGSIARKFDIAVLGYGDCVYSAWSGKLSGKGFVSPGLLLACGREGDRYRWVDPSDVGEKNLADEAFVQARELLEEWMSHQKNKYYYPPTVIHITDGGVQEDRLKSFILASEELKKLCSMDGNVLVWNFILQPGKQREFILPSGDELAALRDGGGLVLYESSSVIPDSISRRLATLVGKDPRMTRRAIGINVTPDTLSKVLSQCILPE